MKWALAEIKFHPALIDFFDREFRRPTLLVYFHSKLFHNQMLMMFDFSSSVSAFELRLYARIKNRHWNFSMNLLNPL